MATSKALGANAFPHGGHAGGLIVQDYVWDVAAGTNADTVLIGYLPADHKLFAAGSGIFALNKAAALAAQTLDVFIPLNEGDAKSTANTVVNDFTVVANTEQHVAFALPLPARALGQVPTNRPVYLDLQAAPATAAGQIIVRLAYFPG